MTDRTDPGNTRPWEVRIYYRPQGHHTHCRVFTGPLGNSAMCGHLVVSTHEWEKFQATMPGVVWIFEKDNGNFFNETGFKIP